MKANLEFNLPEDTSSYHNAVFADEMSGILWNTKNSMRSMLKHGNLSEESYDAVDLLYKELLENLSVLGGEEV